VEKYKKLLRKLGRNEKQNEHDVKEKALLT